MAPRKKKEVEEKVPQQSPYKVFWNWIYSDMKSPIPKGEYIPDLLKYNSPITDVFLLRSFLKCGKLNYFLNNWINNIGVRYIQKEEFFRFIKQAVKDYNVTKYDIFYSSQYKQSTKLFEKLRKRYPDLKSNEISMLCDIVDNSEKKQIWYTSLGLDVVKKETFKVGKKSIAKNTSISLDEFMKNFSVMELI